MDALLKKHRGGDAPGDAPSSELPAPAAQPDAWLPVLTQIIERGHPPAPTSLAAAPGKPLAPAPEAPLAEVSDTLAEQLMSELAPRLSEVMEKHVASELRKNIDETVASLLSQLDVNVREIVREAIEEKLRQQRNRPESE
jgi:hypothetical protein